MTPSSTGLAPALIEYIGIIVMTIPVAIAYRKEATHRMFRPRVALFIGGNSDEDVRGATICLQSRIDEAFWQCETIGRNILGLGQEAWSRWNETADESPLVMGFT